MIEILDTLVGQWRGHGQHRASRLKAAMVSHEGDIDRNALRGGVPGDSGDRDEKHCHHYGLVAGLSGHHTNTITYNINKDTNSPKPALGHLSVVLLAFFLP